jgi:hypothetical protein
MSLRAIAILAAALGLACDTDDSGRGTWEGRYPGECDDGADNDGDGLFDCNDPDCAGAPVCDEDTAVDSPPEGDTDTDADSDTDADADTDTDTDTDVYHYPELMTPADWAWQMDYFTVPADRGLIWELDEDFFLPNVAVPEPFVMPNGNYGMLVTQMGAPQHQMPRGLWVSNDGHDWAQFGIFGHPDEFTEVYCGNRLNDAAVWVQYEDSYRVIYEGMYDVGLDHGPHTADPDPFYFLCHGTTSDFETMTPADDYLWEGSFVGEEMSVPAVLSASDGSGVLFYNGDMSAETPEGPGIRAVAVEQDTLLVTQLAADPILPRPFVDPTPIFVEGGGIRVYHTIFTEEDPDYQAGIGLVHLDDSFQTTDDPVQALISDGDCELEEASFGECLMDPAYLRLPDGTMMLFMTALYIPDDHGMPVIGIKRAIAVD